MTFVFLFGVMFFSFQIGQLAEGAGEIISALNDRIVAMYYPARIVAELTQRFEIWEFLKFLAVNLVVAGAAIAAMGKSYFWIVSRVDSHTGAKKTGKLSYKQHLPSVAIIRKEIRRYFNTPVLVSNTWVGLALYLLAVGAICLKVDEIVAMIIEEEIPITAEMVYTYLPTATFGLVVFSSLLTYITTTMISLEGGAFNLLKTLLVSGRRVLMSKVLASLILTVPALVVGVLALALRFGFGAAETGLLLVATVAIPFVTEMFGILIDLHYARFDAESDAEVVKQSTGVMISAFAGLGAVILTIPISVVVVILVGQIGGMAIIDGLFLLVAGMLWLVLKKHGEKSYRKLSA